MNLYHETHLGYNTFFTSLNLLILFSHSYDVTGNVPHIFKFMCTFANIRELQLCIAVCISEDQIHQSI